MGTILTTQVPEVPVNTTLRPLILRSSLQTGRAYGLCLDRRCSPVQHGIAMAYSMAFWISCRALTSGGCIWRSSNGGLYGFSRRPQTNKSGESHDEPCLSA